MIVDEISLNDTPVVFQKTVSKELDGNKAKLRKVIKKIEYPYIDKNKEMVMYKAYITDLNLMTLISKFDFSDNVSVDRMVIGDCKQFLNYWNE